MKLRMAMIGGGKGSFIGPVHRIAASLDGMSELVSGAFSSKPGINRETADELGINISRVYDDWRDLIRDEAALPPDQRPHFISVVTPNYLHYEPVIESLAAGFNVICDKPLSISLSEAETIDKYVRESNKLFCITYNYTGYPLVKKAREMVTDGTLGKIRKVVVEYLQGWLSSRLEDSGNKQAVWRADPAKAGAAGCMGDIGTHAFNLAEYITGAKTEWLLSQLNSVVEGRILDDDGTVISGMEGGIVCTLLASQVATGEENNLKIRVYGTEGSLTWEQMNPNSLLIKWSDRPTEIYRTASAYSAMGSYANLHTRLPAGHPEGFIEAFSNIYRNYCTAITNIHNGTLPAKEFDYPGITEGVRGMQFLEAVVKSSRLGKKVYL